MRVCVRVFVHQLIALDATRRRWTLLTRQPQVPIAANESDEAKIMWNFPNETPPPQKNKKLSLLQSQLDLVRNDLLIWKWLNELFCPLPMEE